MPPNGTTAARVSYAIRMADPVKDYLGSLTPTNQNPLYQALHRMQDDPYPDGSYRDRDAPDTIMLVIETGGAKYHVSYRVLEDKEKIVVLTLSELRF